VITDLVMPRLNGIELTRRIRQELPQTTIILMSSYPEDAYRLMASDSGADAFVNKQVLNSAADVMTFNRMQVWGSEAGGHGRAPPSSASLRLTDPVPRRGSSSWRLAFACPGRQLRATETRGGGRPRSVRSSSGPVAGLPRVWQSAWQSRAFAICRNYRVKQLLVPGHRTPFPVRRAARHSCDRSTRPPVLSLRKDHCDQYCRYSSPGGAVGASPATWAVGVGLGRWRVA
jgi:CheY-like chemotaxis protein